MDWFMKILGILIACGFLFFAYHFLLRPKPIVTYLKRSKFGKETTIRDAEVNAARFIGALLALIGLYYLGVAVYSFF